MKVTKLPLWATMSILIIAFIAGSFFSAPDETGSLTLLAASTPNNIENTPSIHLMQGLTLHLSTVQVVVMDFAFSADGQLLVTLSGSPENDIQIWDIPSGKLRYTLLRPSDWIAFNVQFTPDGKKVVAAGLKSVPLSILSQIIVWDVNTGQMLTQGELVNGNTTSIAITHDGNSVLAASSILNQQNNTSSGAIYRWDIKTLIDHDQVLSEAQGSIDQMSISPDDKNVFYTVAQSKPPMDLDSMLTPSNMAAYSHMITNGTLKSWNLQSKQAQEIGTYKGSNRALALSPDGTLAGTASEDQSVTVWDIQNRRSKLTFSNSDVLSLAFSPDGKILATGDLSDSDVRLWDTSTWKLLTTLENEPTGFDGQIRKLSFSPNGQFLVVGGEDSLVRFWHIQP